LTEPVSTYAYRNKNYITTGEANTNYILPVVFYGCGPWSLTLREDHRLRIFENRVLMGILGPRREDETGK
jgi:hypothetical protein